MDANLYNISNIESFFCDLLGDSVSEQVFFGDLPRNIDDDWNSIVVVDCSYVSTKDAYAMSIVSILLYSKPFSDGSKNVATMLEMEEALKEAIEASNDEHYKVRLAGSYSNYDSKRNLHCNLQNIELVIL